MKKTLLIILTILVVVLIGVAGLFVFVSSHVRNPGQTNNGGTSSTTFPTSSTTPTNTTIISNVLIKGKSNQPISVPDFVNNGQTVPDKNSPDTYQLVQNSENCLSTGTCASQNPITDFSISYEKKYNFFNITLYTEPLGKSRQEAEQFLVNELKLSPQQLCNLNYSIGTISAVNSVYSGEELGFSSCPNAVQLPL